MQIFHVESHQLCRLDHFEKNETLDVSVGQELFLKRSDLYIVCFRLKVGLQESVDGLQSCLRACMIYIHVGLGPEGHTRPRNLLLLK